MLDLKSPGIHYFTRLDLNRRGDHEVATGVLRRRRVDQP